MAIEMCTGCGIGNGMSIFSEAGFRGSFFRFHGFHDKVFCAMDVVVFGAPEPTVVRSAGPPRRAWFLGVVRPVCGSLRKINQKINAFYINQHSMATNILFSGFLKVVVIFDRGLNADTSK